MKAFVRSVESTSGVVARFPVGASREDLARQVCERDFAARRASGKPTTTIALMRGGKIVDVLHLEGWGSRLGWGG